MASAWIYQDPKQVKKHGIEAASWYVAWVDPEGKQRCKSYGPGEKGKEKAEKHRIILEDQLERGTYKADSRKSWAEFRQEFETRIASGMLQSSKRLTLDALDDFQRLVKPRKMAAIRTQTIDTFISKRRGEQGKKAGTVLSVATVNRQLRHLKAVLRIAHEWKYLPEVPKVRMLKEPGKLPRFITADHFAALYQACGTARWPDDLPNVTAADWWRGILIFAYMTGWRINEILSLRRDDVDLDAATAVTRAGDNKGKRDERIKLHPVVVDHLRRLPGFDNIVFRWSRCERQLYDQFHELQVQAGIDLQPCAKQHKHSDACKVYYGFHDLRRAFATMNAPRLSADALQKLMRHKSYLTTQRYINMASQLDEAVKLLHVPDLGQKPAGSVSGG
jgi:integrase